MQQVNDTFNSITALPPVLPAKVRHRQQIFHREHTWNFPYDPPSRLNCVSLTPEFISPHCIFGNRLSSSARIFLLSAPRSLFRKCSNHEMGCKSCSGSQDYSETPLTCSKLYHTGDEVRISKHRGNVSIVSLGPSVYYQQTNLTSQEYLSL